MTERKYSVAEIDRMREAVSLLRLDGNPYVGSERTVEIEERLRTHMLNGTDPEELERAAAEWMKDYKPGVVRLKTSVVTQDRIEAGAS